MGGEIERRPHPHNRYLEQPLLLHKNLFSLFFQNRNKKFNLASISKMKGGFLHTEYTFKEVVYGR